MNVAHLLTEAAKDRPHHTALLFEGRAFTYDELDRLTDRVASALTGLEAGRGEVVAIFLDSGPELLVAYLGALKAGAVPNVVNGSLQPEEVRHVVADSGARVLVTDPDRWAALGPVRDGLGVRHVLLTGGEPTAGAIPSTRSWPPPRTASQPSTSPPAPWPACSTPRARPDIPRG